MPTSHLRSERESAIRERDSLQRRALEMRAIAAEQESGIARFGAYVTAANLELEARQAAAKVSRLSAEIQQAEADHVSHEGADDQAEFGAEHRELLR